jgi:hypothetical protein
MHRHVTEFREVVVEARTPELARSRACRVGRDEVVLPMASGEDWGEWCDSTNGRTVVDSVDPEPEAVPEDT